MDEPSIWIESDSPIPRGSDADVERLRRAVWACTTRRADGSLSRLFRGPQIPRAGALFLARVDEIGFHGALQRPDGRRRRLFVGDEIVVAYGNRYAPNQFEAVVPKTLGPCQLVASGGVGAKVLSWHDSLGKEPTRITPIALIAGLSGEPACVADFALAPAERLPLARPNVVAVVGTSMDSGKTQTAAYLTRGLTLSGLRVGYAKVTGTGSGGDTWLLRDAGADPVIDFTDAGLVSTYLASHGDVVRSFVTLMAHLVQSGVGAIVLEVADGVLQNETAALLQSTTFRETVDGIIFTASEAMGAVAGKRWLIENGLPLVALSGVMTASPLSVKEASKATGLPILSRSDLAQPRTARGLLEAVRRKAVPPASFANGKETSTGVDASLPTPAIPSPAVAGEARR